ncbi:MAG: hypothetical protein RJQ04_05490 [Longimicrobiales bacterium]
MPSPRRPANRPLLALLGLLTAGALLATPVASQRPAKSPTDPEEVARDLFSRRTPVADVARILVDSHRQTRPTALGILKRVGYAPAAVAGTALGTFRMAPDDAAVALRSAEVDAVAVSRAMANARVGSLVAGRALRSGGYPARDATAALMEAHRLDGYAAYRLLKDAGYTSVQVNEAVAELGMAVDLGCVGPDGHPSPCGAFGGEPDEPAMGQVTWSPQGSAEAASEVVFESTNIPEVDVLFDGQELTLLEMNSSRVRARLPGDAGTGSLALRRRSDGVVGVIEDPYEILPVNPLASVDWGAAAEAAAEGALEDADAWILGSALDQESCLIHANVVTASPGALVGPGFEGNVAARVEAAGAPPEVADAWQASFEEAFLAWADNVTIPGLPWYPAFVAWPGPHTDTLPNVPMPLGALISSGSGAMTPPGLLQRLSESIPGAQSPGAPVALSTFATEVGASFGVFLATAQVMNVMGSGPVPVFAPPPVPAGPVVSGRCYTPGLWISLLPSGVAVDLPDLGGP